MTKYLDLGKIKASEPAREPFEFVVIKNVLNRDFAEEITRDFPQIDDGGSYPLSHLKCGPSFQGLVDEMCEMPLREAISEKFNIDLEGKPTMATIRGRCREKDGKIHTDTDTKLITALLYLNPDWDQDGGRLRLLRKGDDIESTIEEVEPEYGTLLIFKVSKNSWHGHLPFEGVRRSIQLNYIVSEEVVQKELARHRVSAFAKKAKNFLGL
ncbi:MAG: hypothetical protein SP1CHLAM54_09240 [Chlamydiia bacterium]|nr:hypothetical protein [Chlamydiia bacterium]MCH9615830.1 hypothetical protein [Chlamydiia bacterium]MCH9628767.1 hypothetical protein [Chlamydiia bacterium]